MIFDKNDLTKENQKEIKSAYDSFRNSMLIASEQFKRLRQFIPEGDCSEDPPDNINMYTQFELLEDIFSGIKRDELLFLSHADIEKRFTSGKESDIWYDVELVEARDQIQINYERMMFW